MAGKSHSTPIELVELPGDVFEVRITSYSDYKYSLQTRRFANIGDARMYALTMAQCAGVVVNEYRLDKYDTRIYPPAVWGSEDWNIRRRMNLI